MDLSLLTIGELLQVHTRVSAELRRRGVARTANNPCADYAETLVTRAFCWRLMASSSAGFDALTEDVPPQRIEIKARRLGKPNGSREVSALRRLDLIPFDRLIGVLFSPNYDVVLGLDLPIAVVRARSGWSEHTRSAKFHLRDDLVDEPGVLDRTAELRDHNRMLLASMA